MSHKSASIARLVAVYENRDRPAHLLGFVATFNAGRFYEAHDVLEELWLRERHGAEGEFYQGLIQLAGAFVHVEKGGRAPATSLLKLARGRLGAYPAGHLGLDTQHVLTFIEDWLGALASTTSERPLLPLPSFPELKWLRH